MKINSVELSKVTTYRFGGLCKNYIELENYDDLLKISDKINSNNTFVLGKGSNIAFSDKEYKGYVLKPQFEFIENTNDGCILEVGASTYLPDLSRYLKDSELGGGEFLLGIPGSLGGALKMNAGSYGYEIATNVVEVNCYDLNERKLITVDKNTINYRYRQSENLDNKVILSAVLKFEHTDPKLIAQKMSEFNNQRKKSQPPGIYNAGSVFKNSEGYFAGELIDNAGLKGYSIDNVSVSTKHANFFIAKKGAKASSLYNLVQYVKEKVYDKYKVRLEEEIQFIGEFT
jgi:UDP-N-acetylmuramate dehydrogenase